MTKLRDYGYTNNEVDFILDSFLTACWARGLNTIDPNEVKAIIQTAIDYDDPFELHILGPCVVGFSVIQPWWSSLPILREDFIHRWKPGSIKETYKLLEALGKDRGCGHVVIGTLVHPDQSRYGKLLTHLGYTELSQEFAKEI